MKSWQDEIKFYDETPKTQRHKVLAFGKTKVGKTYLGGTFPDPFFIDTDGSLDGLEESHVPHITISRSDALSRDIKVYSTVDKIIRSLRDREEPFKTKHKIQTLVLDGVTSLADLLMVELMLDSRIGKTARDPLVNKATYDEYGALGNRLMTIFTMIDDLDINIYVTAGLKMDKDEVSGYIMGMPDVLGSFRQQIGHRFDAVLYLEKEKEKFLAYTVEHSRIQAGVRRWKGDDVIENPTFGKIFNKKNFK